MASLKEIKSRIDSVNSIHNVTDSMYLISASEYHFLNDRVNHQNSFLKEIEKAAAPLLRLSDRITSIYSNPSLTGVEAYIFIGSDKGLCGDYNKQICKKAIEIRKKDSDGKFFVIGEKIKKFFDSRNIDYEKDFNFCLNKFTIYKTDEVSSFFLEIFKSDKIKNVYAIYNVTDTGIQSETVIDKILPLKANVYPVTECDEYIPSEQTVADVLLPLYFREKLKTVLLRSYIAEQKERMTAMHAANDNAKELINSLTLQYNHQRQNAITREITEISGERNKNGR